MATPPVFSAGAVLTAAQMNAVGMWRVSTKTFSAAADVTFDDVFTSDFRNYRIVFDAVHSSTYVNVFYRLRSGGSDNTSSSYWYRSFYVDTALAVNNASGDNKGFFCTITTTYNATAQDIFLPQVAQRTAISGMFYDQHNPYTWVVGGGFVSTTQFDGIKLYPNTGTMTGQATIYGYND